MEDQPLTDAGGSRFTMRLRLEPVGPANAADLWRVHDDDEVWPWYANDDWGQIHPLLPAEPWVRIPHGIHRPLTAHAYWLEIGWALPHEYRGLGYASEIGHAGLAFAFDDDRRNPWRAGRRAVRGVCAVANRRGRILGHS